MDVIRDMDNEKDYSEPFAFPRIDNRHRESSLELQAAKVQGEIDKFLEELRKGDVMGQLSKAYDAEHAADTLIRMLCDGDYFDSLDARAAKRTCVEKNMKSGYYSGNVMTVDDENEYIALPKDSEGNAIYLDDEIWDIRGISKFAVDAIELRHDGKWRVCDASRTICKMADSCLHYEPDSWEKVEEDARKSSCRYFEKLGSLSCDDCDYSGMTFEEICDERERLDIIRRCKALAGVTDAE